MNRYVRDGLLADMRAGKQVLLVSPTFAIARHSLDVLARQVEDDAAVEVHYSLGRGRETVKHQPSGGRILCTSLRSQGGRGFTADVVYLDDPDRSADALTSVAPCVAVGGELLLP